MCLYCGAPERFYTRNGTRLAYGSLDYDHVITKYGGFREGNLRAEPGLYMAVGPAPQNRILYVGRAKSVQARITTHRASPWFRLFGEDVRWFTLYSQGNLMEMERLLIQQADPPGNCVGRHA